MPDIIIALRGFRCCCCPVAAAAAVAGGKCCSWQVLLLPLLLLFSQRQRRATRLQSGPRAASCKILLYSVNRKTFQGVY